MPEERLLRVGPVQPHPVERAPETFAAFVCERCGDMVSEKYGRLVGDRRVCIPCQQELLAGAKD